MFVYASLELHLDRHWVDSSPIPLDGDIVSRSTSSPSYSMFMFIVFGSTTIVQQACAKTSVYGISYAPLIS